MHETVRATYLQNKAPLQHLNDRVWGFSLRVAMTTHLDSTTTTAIDHPDNTSPR